MKIIVFPFFSLSSLYPLFDFKGGLAAGGLKGWMRVLTALFVPL